MRTLTLNPETIVVDTFPIEADEMAIGRPRTFEPGCTLPEICGGTP